MTQMEFDILGDGKKKKVTAAKKKVTMAMLKSGVEKAAKPAAEKERQVAIGDIVHFAVGGENEIAVHPCIVLKVNDTGSVNVNIFFAGYITYMEKLPFTGKKVVLGSCHFAQKV